MDNHFKVGKLKLKKQFKPVYVPKKTRQEEEKAQNEHQQIKTKDQIINHEPKVGTGQITCSGRTIHGNDTKFRQQIQQGDLIIIEHPTFKTKQERTVQLILSSKSILIDEPYVEEYSQFLPFMVRKKSIVIPGKNLTAEYQKKLEELGKTKGIQKKQIDVRLKKGFWSYESKKVEVKDDLSREQLLDIRQKMIKDKHCW